MATNIKTLALVTGGLIVIYLLLGSMTKDAKKTAVVAMIDNPYETDSYYTTTASAWMNQKFTAPSDFTMSGVNLMIEKNGGTGMVVEIRDTVTTTIVGVDYDMSGVSAGKQVVFVPLSVPLVSGRVYSLQMSAIGGNMRVYFSNANPYSGGNMGMNWVYSDANDMYFQIMYDNGGASAGTCTGTTPTNAQLCAGDDIVTVDTPITLTTTCSAAMCEYTCNIGFVVSGGACVPETAPICEVTFQEFIDRANAWVNCGSDTC